MASDDRKQATRNERPVLACVEPTLGIEPRTPSLRVASDRAYRARPASTQTPTVPQSPLFLMGMLARLLARIGVKGDSG